jgi:hypothetical protein
MSETARDALLQAIALANETHELRRNGEMLAWIQRRPSYCDRGRYHAGLEVNVWRSEADPWPRYYFDLARAKAEVEAYLVAKKIDVTGAAWGLMEAEKR